MMGINHFGVVDYIVVAATLLFSLGIGMYYALFSKQTNEDLLVGGRNMGAIPIAASMLVTYLSAITILGYPAEVYQFGIQIFMMTIASLVYVPVSAYLFVSVFYKMKLTSVYEYLELRFDSIVVRWLASFTFVFQVLLITGVVLYAPAIALETILGLPVWISITGIGLCGTIYTSIGGLKAVVWTDVFQFVMIIVGMISIVTKGIITAGGFTKVFTVAAENGRLDLFDFSVSIYERHNTLNFILGYGFTVIAFYGTHQPQVQRYCSLPTYRDALKAIFVCIPMKVFTMGLVVLTGLSVFATYSGCDPILLGEIKKADQIVPYFVIKELSFIPGMMGLFVSCVFSAVLSSVSSILNSLAAVTWEDFVSKIPCFNKMGDKAQTTSVRIISVLYGILCIFLAFLAQNLGQIFQATMTAVGATAGALGAVFYMGLFMPCINHFGAIFGMLAGLTSMMYVGVQSFILAKKVPFFLPLPNNILDCPEGTNFSRALNSTVKELTEIPYPEKIFTISYILYPCVGAIITIVVGLIVSLVTGGFCKSKTVNRKYLHPVIHRFCCCVGEETETAGQKYRAVVQKTVHPIDHYPPPSSRFSYPYESVPITETKVT